MGFKLIHCKAPNISPWTARDCKWVHALAGGEDNDVARGLDAAICDSWRRRGHRALAGPLFRCSSRRGRAGEQPPQQETPAPGLGME